MRNDRDSPQAVPGAGTRPHWLDRYCVGCSSTGGYNPERPDFCEVCWDNRQPIPHDLRLKLEEHEEMLDIQQGRMCVLTKEKRFQSGMTLSAGAIVFVRITPAGPIATFYPNLGKSGSSHAFAIEPDEYSILKRGKKLDFKWESRN